ncbi:MAG: glycosyltransferase [Schleiferiaceae bacterium]|nr:glycosyltransferase [Schleiferiaceae bacterium]
MILWLTYWYPDESHPIRGNFIRAQWRAAKAAGADVELLFVDMALGPKLMDVSWLRGPEGEYILRVRSRMWKSLYHTPVWATNLLAKQWTKKTGLSKPEAIHAQVVFPAGILADQLGRRWNVPYFITEHWSKAGRWTRHKLFGKRVRTAYQDANGIFPVSEHLKSELQQALPNIGASRFTVVPNAVDLSMFPHIDKPPQPKASSFTLLGVASLIPANARIKRVDLILEALVELKRRQPDVHWTYRHVGEGGRLNRLQDYSKGLGIASNVEWLGAMDAEELQREYSTADVFVQASQTETFGIVVLEALHSGLPVVASDIPAFEQWIQPGRGFKVALDSKAIANGVIEVWNEGLRAAPMELEAKKYAPTEVGAQLSSLYSRLVRSAPAR